MISGFLCGLQLPTRNIMNRQNTDIQITHSVQDAGAITVKQYIIEYSAFPVHCLLITHYAMYTLRNAAPCAVFSRKLL